MEVKKVPTPVVAAGNKDIAQVSFYEITPAKLNQYGDRKFFEERQREGFSKIAAGGHTSSDAKIFFFAFFKETDDIIMTYECHTTPPSVLTGKTSAQTRQYVPTILLKTSRNTWNICKRE
jgi:hypothetical protein